MNEYHYHLGGSLGRDAPSYVVRQADQEIYETLKAGKFTYVITKIITFSYKWRLCSVYYFRYNNLVAISSISTK